MIEENWRAIVIIERDQSREIDPTIQRLKNLGIDHVHLIAPPGVRVTKTHDHIPHQGNRGEWENSYDLWRGGLQLLSTVYASRSELFLIIRPGVDVWNQLLTYCEYTIPRDVVAVWSPLNPDKAFPASDRVRPDCGESFGWCRSPVSRDMVSSHCFVVTGHVLTLMANYLPPVEDGAAVSSMIAEHMGRRSVPFYFHSPSLATVRGSEELVATDFVGVSHNMKQELMWNRQFIFEPTKT